MTATNAAIEADRRESIRIAEVTQLAADRAYRARVKAAFKRRNDPRHPEEFIESRRAAGIDVIRWIVLRHSTREAASPEEFQTFARLLGVSARWLAIGDGPRERNETSEVAA